MGHCTSPAAVEKSARVAAGATPTSLRAAPLPGLNEMAGLEVQYRRTVSGRREARVATERPGLEGDATLTWEAGASSSHVVCATTGTVVATGAEGAPLLVEHRWGEGVVAFLAEPVERYLCGRSGVSATDETWRLYRYLKALAGIRAPIECAHPNVEVGLLREGENRVVVLVNHSDSPVEAVLTVDPSVAGLADLDGRLPAAGTCTWNTANGGAVCALLGIGGTQRWPGRTEEPRRARKTAARQSARPARVRSLPRTGERREDAPSPEAARLAPWSCPGRGLITEGGKRTGWPAW